MLTQFLYTFLSLGLLGSITAVVILLIRAIFSRSVKKSVFVLLWLIVFLRLSIPVSIPSPTSVFNLIKSNGYTVSGSVNIIPDILKENLDITDNTQINTHQTVAVGNESIKFEEPVKNMAAPQEVKNPLSPSAVAGFIWLGGIVVLIAIYIGIYIAAINRNKNLSLLDEKLLYDCKKIITLRRPVSLLQSKDISSPYVFGIFRSKIVLPDIMGTYENKSFQHIILHELIHIKRFDNLIKLFAFLVLCLHWYNPVIWLSYIFLQRDLEASCDEKVVKLLGENAKKAYAESLYEFACKKNTLDYPGIMTFGETGTKKRIRNILSYKKSTLSAVIIACCLIVTVLAGWATNPVAAVVAASPLNNSKVVYAAEEGLYGTDLGGSKPVLLVKGSGIYLPVFSETGREVAYLQNDTLYAFDFKSRKSRTLAKSVESFCSGKDEEFYVSLKQSGIVSVNAANSKRTTIVTAQKDALFINLKLSPNGQFLAYDLVASGINNQGKAGTWLYDTKSKKSQQIIKAAAAEYDSMGIRPAAGKWSPDSGRIFIWLMSQSGSLSADGVGTAIYDIASGKLLELDAVALAYDENLNYLDRNNFALISGGSRMMFEAKRITLFDLQKGLPSESVDIGNKVPAAPNYSADGKRMIFSASPAAKPADDYKKQISSIAARQLYLRTEGKLYPLTNDGSYRSEAPGFLKDNNYILFTRVNTSGEKSVWLMDSDGKNMKKLAGWKYKDLNDPRDTDFYGRIEWDKMVAVYDSTEERSTVKMPLSAVDVEAEADNSNDNLNVIKQNELNQYELNNNTKNSIRAVGKSDYGTIKIKAAGAEETGRLGADSSYGKAEDYSFRGNYQIVFEDNAGTVKTICEIKDLSIIQPEKTPVNLKKLRVGETDIFYFIPEYAGSNDVTAYFFGITKDGNAFLFNIESNKASEFGDEKILSNTTAILTMSSKEYTAPGVKGDNVFFKAVYNIGEGQNLTLFNVTFNVDVKNRVLKFVSKEKV
ncbi:MAG: antirepressor regulating drug resistance protein [Eubacterium sp.]|nr:antirepressor regulating drug resistance protein [Eubacterium sp.]